MSPPGADTVSYLKRECSLKKHCAGRRAEHSVQPSRLERAFFEGALERYVDRYRRTASQLETAPRAIPEPKMIAEISAKFSTK